MRVLITGANRGIGLGLVRHCLKRKDRVFAACRTPNRAAELQTLCKDNPGQLSLHTLDVRDSDQIEALHRDISTQVDGLDVLINNAGIYYRGLSLGELTAERSLETLHVNAVAPMIITQSLMDLLIASKNGKVVNLSTGMSSITSSPVGAYDYRASKAALNMYTRVLAQDMRPFGVIAIVINPGWVKTDMGGQGATISAEESARGIMKVVDALRPQDSGKFFQWDGTEHVW
ncbi:MAG: SDR family oxidoreductase [Melioribacteraceae bacterium]|nr:SDR family oxidoreductase [Melioribacteraceae bacterium]